MRYSIMYKLPGIFSRWETIENVTGDGVESGCRYFHTEEDDIWLIPQTAVFKYPKARQDSITKEMSKQAGQPVQRG